MYIQLLIYKYIRRISHGHLDHGNGCHVGESLGGPTPRVDLAECEGFSPSRSHMGLPPHPHWYRGTQGKTSGLRLGRCLGRARWTRSTVQRCAEALVGQAGTTPPQSLIGERPCWLCSLGGPRTGSGGTPPPAPTAELPGRGEALPSGVAVARCRHQRWQPGTTLSQMWPENGRGPLAGLGS